MAYPLRDVFLFKRPEVDGDERSSASQEKTEANIESPSEIRLRDSEQHLYLMFGNPTLGYLRWYQRGYYHFFLFLI